MARKTTIFSRRSAKRKAAKNMFKVISAGCGKELLMEVSPPGKPLLCPDCYNK
jgi:hypothetical protein